MASPRRRLAPELRREQLLDSAIALAAGGDIASISVEEVAAHAGVSEGLLYHYFTTKQALVVAAVRRAADAFIADLRAAAVGPPLARLTAGLGAYLDHVQAQPTGWRALLHANTADLAEIGADVEQESLRLALDALGIAEPTAVLLVTLAGWAQLERSICLGWLEHPDLERAAVEDLLASTFIAALTSAGRHDPVAEAALSRITSAS
jgi:AcrR family transcriptional regulator